MSELAEKVRSAIENVRSFQSLAQRRGGYYLAFSGGKDSVVTKAIMDMAGVPYEAFYRVSSVDPPELVSFVKQYHKDVHVEIPHDDNDRPITMWSLIPKKKTPPTRVARYCCEFLKESGGDGRFAVTGVRWAESRNRKRNQGLVTVTSKGKKILQDDSENFLSTPRGGWCS